MRLNSPIPKLHRIALNRWMDTKDSMGRQKVVIEPALAEKGKFFWESVFSPCSTPPALAVRAQTRPPGSFSIGEEGEA